MTSSGNVVPSRKSYRKSYTQGRQQCEELVAAGNFQRLIHLLFGSRTMPREITMEQSKRILPRTNAVTTLRGPCNVLSCNILVLWFLPFATSLTESWRCFWTIMKT